MDPDNPYAPYGGYFNRNEYGRPAGYPGSQYGLPGQPRGPSFMGFGGTPGGGGLEGAVQTIMPMFAEMFREKMGGFGFNFGSDMNIVNSQYAREFNQQLNAARASGAEQDRGQVSDLLRGLARMIGHEERGRDPFGQVRFGADVEQAMTRMTADISKMMPILAAMFPDQVDQFLPRGSMTVGAASFVSAGRFIIDPTTGRPISEDKDYGPRVLSSLLNERSGASTAGLGAGRLGQTFEQLVSAGLVGGGGTALGALSMGLSAGGLPGGDIAKAVQAEEIKQQIAGYARVVASINDIFTEAGKPNSPMGDLIKGLQTMTQGGMGRYDPATLTRIVRTMQAASQTTGMSLDQITQMSAGLGGALRQYGGPEMMAAPLASYAAAVRQSYINRGYGRERLEGTSPDEFRNIYADTLAAGLGSSQLNMIGALSYQAQLAPEGSPLAMIGKGLSLGKTTIDLPGGRQINLLRANQQDLEQMFTESGLNPQAFLAQMNATELNKAALTGLPIGVTQAAQAEEFGKAVRSSAVLRVQLAKGDEKEMERIIDAIGVAARAPGAEGAAHIARRTAALLGRSDDPAFASALTPELARWTTEYTRFGRDVAAPWRAFDTGDGGLTGGADWLMDAITKRGDLADRMSHLGRGNFLRNFGRTIRDYAIGDEPSLLNAFGGIIGMVGLKDVFGDRWDQAGQAIQGAIPGAGGQGITMSLGWLRNVKSDFDKSSGNLIGQALGPLLSSALGGVGGVMGVGMPGVGIPGMGNLLGPSINKAIEKDEARKADLKSGKAVDIKADIAKLEIKIAGDGGMSAVLTAAAASAFGLAFAAKTMTGDGTAVPPGEP